MAQTKVASSKSSTSSILYGREGKDKKTEEKKCIAMSGLNVDPSNAEYEFRVVRQAFNKAKNENQDIQAHLIEQSFKGRDIDPDEVNQMGYELAERLNEKLGGGFQAVVYTHGNTSNYHNHIVFNAVNLEDGHKYHCYQEKKIVEQINDQIVREHGYPVIEKYKERGTSVTIKEQKMRDENQYVWKDDLRERIDQAFTHTKDSLQFSLERFKDHLHDLGVNVRERFNQKHQTTLYSYDFIDQDGKKRITREKNLGVDYSAKGIQDGLEQERQSYEQYRQQFRPRTGDHHTEGELSDGHTRIQQRGGQVLQDRIRAAADEKLQRNPQAGDVFRDHREQKAEGRTSEEYPDRTRKNRGYEQDEPER